MLLTLAAGGPVVAQAQQLPWRWLQQGTEARSAVLQRLVTDAAGNTYLTGRFSGQLRLGATRLVSQGRSDAFVAKLTSGGQWAWAVAAGGSGSDEATDLALDATGNVLVTGAFEDIATFGLQKVTSQGRQDVFVAALTPEGRWRGVLTAGGPGQDEAMAVTVDAHHAVWVGGRFQDRAVFGGHHLQAAAGNDGFVARLDPTGTWEWARQLDASEQGAVRRMVVDAQGGVVVTGYVGGTARFGEHPLVSQGTHNGYVARLSSSGTWQWASGGLSTSTTYASAVVVDEQNQVFVAGSYSGTTAFGPHQLTSHGGDDAFVACLTPTGEWHWVRSVQGPALETVRDLAWVAPGTLGVVGSSSREAVCAGIRLPGQGGLDVLLGRLTVDGRWLEVRTVGTAGADEGTALGLGANGELLVGGTLSGTDFAAGIAPQVFVGQCQLPPAGPAAPVTAGGGLPGPVAGRPAAAAQ
ncbi:hypothetical protein EI291_22315 [Hymenobacter rigui]|uniref:Uncharacterized protein n=1 Tax=Hymenobacter rigui TaxID=334424 RepID=A0A428K9I0_9BACT|nr:hypothetical protein EI291_22315 [Hymenobacter rigui]